MTHIKHAMKCLTLGGEGVSEKMLNYSGLNNTLQGEHTCWRVAAPAEATQCAQGFIKKKQHLRGGISRDGES